PLCSQTVPATQTLLRAQKRSDGHGVEGIAHIIEPGVVEHLAQGLSRTDLLLLFHGVARRVHADDRLLLHLTGENELEQRRRESAQHHDSLVVGRRRVAHRVGAH
ncbi:MAG: hypothetical protein ACK55I_14440, partial [bacterium]